MTFKGYRGQNLGSKINFFGKLFISIEMDISKAIVNLTKMHDFARFEHPMQTMFKVLNIQS